MSLSDSYAHYDRMVNNWLSELHAISEPFLPEYWWGWTPDNGTPLRAVVINLNPGTGNELQSRRSLRGKFGACFSYRRLMSDRLIESHLPESVAWHKKRRENPLLKALELAADSQTFPSNTLCIESYPFHSDAFDDNQAKKYLEAFNGREFWRMMEFAAEASRLVSSPLTNIVLIRISQSRWEKITAKFRKYYKLSTTGPSQQHSIKIANGCAAEYSFLDIDNLNDIRFICVWDANGRNHFPTNLREIFTELNIVNNAID